MLNGVLGEFEYEFNQVLMLKKVATFFVILATKQEPDNEQELFKVC